MACGFGVTWAMFVLMPVVKLVCPSTTSAEAPLAVGIELKIRTRLLCVSATNSFPFCSHTPCGPLRDRAVGGFNVAPVVKSGCPTPLADLPQEPIEGTGVAAVVRGEVPYLLTAQEDHGKQVAVLVVPLRSGGRIFGAMAMTAQGSFPFSRTDMALAQQLADLAGPHLDLARRSVGSPPPFAPGWKRSSWRPTSQQG